MLAPTRFKGFQICGFTGLRDRHHDNREVGQPHQDASRCASEVTIPCENDPEAPSYAALTSSPLVSPRQPRRIVVSHEIPRLWSRGSKPFGRLTSSSHITPVGHFGRIAKRLGEALTRKF
jgi:hypothetical protein